MLTPEEESGEDEKLVEAGDAPGGGKNSLGGIVSDGEGRQRGAGGGLPLWACCWCE